MSTSTPPSFTEYKIQSALAPAPSKLSDRQALLTTSVLDLFAGFPSKRKLSLWTDDAVFSDSLTIATGRKQYEAQWYGLKATMSEIIQEEVAIKRVGNPMELHLKTKYKVKAVGKEQVIDSTVLVHTTDEGEGAKITKVEDKWGGTAPPEGFFAKAMRNLNSVTVPGMVSVPKSIEEEEGTA
ncbi:hypothetical protein LTS15_006380 [Exophiala xenobiotica]|nr:hypothetical protein LTS15_006380 [Exophiala xenobiotica]